MRCGNNWWQIDFNKLLVNAVPGEVKSIPVVALEAGCNESLF
jgi:hypothetical protein